MAIVATHLAACAGALTWMVLEWWTRGKPSVLGMISGAIAGLGTITPASGFVLPWHGVVIGLIAGAVCFWACTKLKLKCSATTTRSTCSACTASAASPARCWPACSRSARCRRPRNAGRMPGLLEGNPQQLLAQLYGVVVTIVWSGVVTFVLLKVDRRCWCRCASASENEIDGPRRQPARRSAAITRLLAATARFPARRGLAFGDLLVACFCAARLLAWRSICAPALARYLRRIAALPDSSPLNQQYTPRLGRSGTALDSLTAAMPAKRASRGPAQ